MVFSPAYCISKSLFHHLFYRLEIQNFRLVNQFTKKKNYNGFDTIMFRTSYIIKVQIYMLKRKNLENISVI